MTAHEYGRGLEDAARSLCERMKVNADQLIEMPFPPELFFRRWQLIAQELVMTHAERLPAHEAETFRFISVECILAGGVGPARCENLQ